MSGRVLEVIGNEFRLGGEPFRFMGGAMHYARVPRPLWPDRLRKLIDLGCNTVETYSFWNAHEPRPGQFEFDDMLDVVAFTELAGSLGLNVIIRPGPYCCAEWDFGGLPWQLMNEPHPAVRCMNDPYLKAVERYWTELFRRLAPLQSTRGGPLIAMQVENEYGSFGNDTKYVAWLRDLMRKLGIDVFLFTSDGTYQRITIATGGLDDVLKTANFGSGATERFKILRDYQKTGPIVCMEFWIGWFDEWRTDKHITRPAAEVAAELDEILSQNAGCCIYMFHGGTNFGFTAGGNSRGERFMPFVTSYDYDALLDECGDVTPKFEACREVIHKHLKLDRPKTTFAPSRKVAYGEVKLTESVSLDEALPSIGKPVESGVPLTFEQLDEGRGFVVYRTELPPVYRGEPLVIRGMHDWCHVRLNGKTLATWYRNDPQPDMVLNFDTPTAKLEILVHNLARSNFGHRMLECKGITDGVLVGKAEPEWRAIFGWTNTALPLEKLPNVPFKTGGAIDGPAFYRGTLQVDGEPADTFLELPGFHLGCVFLNGFNLGRYWNVGPQQTLYVPAPMLKRGVNEIVVFEALRCDKPTLVFRDTPELNQARVL